MEKFIADGPAPSLDPGSINKMFSEPARGGELLKQVQEATKIVKEQIERDKERKCFGTTRGGVQNKPASTSPAVSDFANELYWKRGGGSPSGGIFDFVSAYDSNASLLAPEVTRQQLQALPDEQERHDYLAHQYEVAHLLDDNTIAVEKCHRLPKRQQRSAKSGAWKNVESISASALFVDFSQRIADARGKLRRWFKRDAALRKNLLKGKPKKFGSWCELLRIFQIGGISKALFKIRQSLSKKTKDALRVQNVQRRGAAWAKTKAQFEMDMARHAQQYPTEAERVLDDARCTALRILEMSDVLNMNRREVSEIAKAGVEPCAHYQIRDGVRSYFTSYVKLFLYAMVAKLRLILLHYKKPNKKNPAAPLCDSDWERVKTRWKYWMNEARKRALNQVPDDDAETKKDIEAISLDEELGRKLLSPTPTFVLMKPSECAEFADQYYSKRRDRLQRTIGGPSLMDSDGEEDGDEESEGQEQVDEVESEGGLEDDGQHQTTRCAGEPKESGLSNGDSKEKKTKSGGNKAVAGKRSGKASAKAGQSGGADAGFKPKPQKPAAKAAPTKPKPQEKRLRPGQVPRARKGQALKY
eukprot:g6458.t1